MRGNQRKMKNIFKKIMFVIMITMFVKNGLAFDIYSDELSGFYNQSEFNVNVWNDWIANGNLNDDLSFANFTNSGFSNLNGAYIELNINEETFDINSLYPYMVTSNTAALGDIYFQQVDLCQSSNNRCTVALSGVAVTGTPEESLGFVCDQLVEGDYISHTESYILERYDTKYQFDAEFLGLKVISTSSSDQYHYIAETVTCGDGTYDTSDILIKSYNTTKEYNKFTISDTQILNGGTITPKIKYGGVEYSFTSGVLNLVIPTNSNFELKYYITGNTTHTPQLSDINLNAIDTTEDPDTEMFYILNGGLETNICANQLNCSLNFTGQNGINSIQFLLVDNFGNDTIMKNFTIDLITPIINISNITESESYVTTWNNFFNYSDINIDSCYLIVENTSQNCLSYEFLENGYQLIDIYVNDSAGNIENQNFTLFVNPYQYFYFEDPASNPITNFTLDGIPYDEYAAIKVHDYGIGPHNLTFTRYGYANTNVIFNLDLTSKYNLTTEVQISLLYITLYDVDNLNLINQTVEIDLIGESFAGSFITTNGSIIITNITELPDIYELNIRSLDYEDLNYYFQHTGYAAVNLNLYLQNTSDTIPIKYVIKDSFGDPYDDSSCLVELQIYQLSTNSYESFVMDYTNSIAEVIFNLDTTEKFKPFVTCGGSTQIYDGGKITSTPVYLKFSESSLDIFPSNPSISSGITFVELSNSTARFKFSYDDLNNIISQACLNITVTDYNSETIVVSQCLSTASGSINVDFNITTGLTYKAYGLIEYEGEFQEVNTYYKKISQAVFDFGIWGVIFGLTITGLLSVGGFFAGKAKGVLIGATIGLWISSFAMFGVWFMPVSTPLIIWSVLLIVGVIFS